MSEDSQSAVTDFEKNGKNIFNDKDYSASILKGLKELRKEGRFCDVTLMVDNKSFPVHKIVLASASPYFQAMFTSPFAESVQDVIPIQDVNVVAMELLLDYVYSGVIEFNSENAQFILFAANLFQFNNVKEAAAIFLLKELKVSNAIKINCFAELHSCERLIKESKNFILKNFVTVCEEDEFCNLSHNKLIEFLKCDELQTANEEMVFRAVNRWFLHDPENRKVNFYKVLENVRLPIVSPYFLHDCVENAIAVHNIPKCKTIIEKAKEFQSLPDRRFELMTAQTKPRDFFSEEQVIVILNGRNKNYSTSEREYSHSYSNYNYESPLRYYKINKNVWGTLPSPPRMAKKQVLVASGKNILYIAGGENYGSPIASVFRYDPILESWKERQPMINGRSEFGLAVLDGCLYAVGNNQSSSRLNAVEKYVTDKNLWVEVAPMCVGVTAPACVGYNGQLYVIGGEVSEAVDWVQRYDPETNTWVKLAPMPLPLSGSSACVFNGYIYVFGGQNFDSEYPKFVQRYNVEENKWQFVEPMSRGRYKPGVAVVGGKIFVIGGEDFDEFFDDGLIECYDPERDIWSIHGQMNFPISSLGCATIRIQSHSLKTQ